MCTSFIIFKDFSTVKFSGIITNITVKACSFFEYHKVYRPGMSLTSQMVIYYIVVRH